MIPEHHTPGSCDAQQDLHDIKVIRMVAGGHRSPHAAACGVPLSRRRCHESVSGHAPV